MLSSPQQAPLVIIGSGYAGLQVARQYRKLVPDGRMVMISADQGADYPKPQLSHAVSQRKTIVELTTKNAAELMQELRMMLLHSQSVDAIDPAARVIRLGQREIPYSQLVLAVGADAFVPPCPGAIDHMVTLNSLREYDRHRESLWQARHITIIGGGLIGCELAHDFAVAGKQVALVDSAPTILGQLLPSFASKGLQQRLAELGVELCLDDQLQAVEATGAGYQVFLKSGIMDTDVVVSATGLRPRLELARLAGLETRRGIVVDASLRTSDPQIYAIGDCMELDGRLWPYLQPITLAAQALARNLAGQEASVHFPVMPVNIKTGSYPLQCAGEVMAEDVTWQQESMDGGWVATAWREENMVGAITQGTALMRMLGLLGQLQNTAPR